MIRTAFLHLAFILALGCAAPAGQPAARSSALASQPAPAVEQVAQKATPLAHVDHFYVMTSDVKTAMSCLTDTLGLPVAWPVDPFSNGTTTVTTGGAFAGNLNIELVVPFLGDLRFSGIAFKPGAPVDEVVTQLAAAGMTPMTPPQPFVIKNVNRDSPTEFWRRVRDYTDAEGGPAWTTVGLMDIGHVPHGGTPPDNGTHLFLCEYHMGMERINDHNRSSFSGGPAGIIGVSEITVQVAEDRDGAEARLNALLGDGFAERTGVDIEVMAGDRDRFVGFTLRVASVERATEHLGARGIAVDSDTDGQSFECPGLPDVRISLRAE